MTSRSSKSRRRKVDTVEPTNPMDVVEASEEQQQADLHMDSAFNGDVKVMFDLDDKDVEAAVADALPAFYGGIEAMTFGNRKHGIHRWHHQQDCDWRFIEKLQRHLIRYLMARTAHDVDSGLHHLKHLMANAILLYEQERLKGGILDGPGPESR